MNILVIDDDKLVATSLKTIIESNEGYNVCALGHDGTEAITYFREYIPDVLLMDIRMATMTGLEAADVILKEYPEARILFLTTFSDDEYIVKALRMGAKGYLLKQDFESIIPALKAVSTGQSVFGGEIVSKLPHLIANDPKETAEYSQKEITEKEMELIQFVAEGLSNREIAEKMYLSEGTVRNYLSSVLDKLALRDRTQLAIYYYKHKS